MNWLITALLGMFFQGLVLFIVKVLSFNVNPLVVLFYQYLGSMLLVIIYLLVKKINIKLKKPELWRALLSGLLVSHGLVFYYLAISEASVSRVTSLHNVGLTLIPSLLAFTYLKEEVNKRVIIGLICAVLSIVFITL